MLFFFLNVLLNWHFNFPGTASQRKFKMPWRGQWALKKTVQRSKRCVSPQPPVPVALPLLVLLEALFGDIALHRLSEVWVAVHCPVCALGQALCCAAGEQFCTQTPHPFHFTVLPMWAHTHTHMHILSQHFHTIHLLWTVLRYGFGQDPRNVIHDIYSWYWLCIPSAQECTLQ